ncbi:MAG: hypothetical protein Q8P67_11410 [archaeon]|nr:hypothetical protein [archaeon]
MAASYLLTEGSFFFRPRRRLFSSSFFAPQGNPADPPTSMGNALDDDLQSDLRSDLARQLREESSGDNLREMGTDEIDSIQEILARRWIKEDFLVGDTDDDDDISSSKSYPSQNPTPKRNPKQNPSTTAPRQGEGEEAEEPAEYESTDAYFGRPRAYAEPYRDPTEAPELRSERMALERIASGPDGARAVKACIGLGHGHFEKRWGRDIHREQSRRWFMRAALMGDPLAMRIVALRFEMHRGNKQLILKKSAELGDVCGSSFYFFGVRF